VIWTEAAAAPLAGRAYCVPYPSIAMHAMSSALDPDQPAAQQRPCIYMQLDAVGSEAMRDDGVDNDGDEDDAAVPELHLIPADPSTRVCFSLLGASRSAHLPSLFGCYCCLLVACCTAGVCSATVQLTARL